MTTTFAPQDEALWAAIAAFPMDDPNASMPFTKRLARDHLWTDAYAQTVVEEYKKFVYLMATAQPGVTTTPSEDVDEAWHLHMVYTRSYWDDLCTKVLGKALHHGPTGGKEQTGGFKEAYADTLKRYEQSFGPVSNTLVWPSVKDRFGHKNGAQYLTVSTQDFRVVTKTKAHLVWAAFIVIMVAGLGSMMPQQSLAFGAALWACWWR